MEELLLNLERQLETAKSLEANCRKHNDDAEGRYYGGMGEGLGYCIAQLKMKIAIQQYKGIPIGKLFDAGVL